jgi:TIR domain
MTDQQFDVFLCHNSEDKPAVKEIAAQLKAQNIKPWLDEWELRPGYRDWQDILEEQIGQINSAAIFIGNNGLGPWQKQELKAFLREFNDQNCPIIPVLLNSAPEKPKLPIFLRGKTWVDFRSQSPNPLSQLIWGITGIREPVIVNPIIIKSDPITVKPGSANIEPKNLEWVGDWFVHVGEEKTRTWADCVKYGFISAGQGVKYSDPLKKLEVGSTLYAYMTGLGYVGLGKVVQKATPIRDFTVGPEKTSLLEVELQAENPGENSDNLALSEWVVGVKWLKTFPKEQARRFVGAFANQNVACKLRNKATLEFLREEFGWAGDWFVNVGEGSGQRVWEDCLNYEFMSAGQGARFADAMKKLEIGSTVYAYIGGSGYVGFGSVIEKAVPIKEFSVGSQSVPLLEMDLKSDGLDRNSDNTELSEWVVRMKWIRTFPREQAQWFSGAFAHRSAVCKLRERKTLDFLHRKFGE